MPKNRVHELEETVEQLQGTVDGLTVELVEVNKRLRALEGELEPIEESEELDETASARNGSALDADGSDIIIC